MKKGKAPTTREIAQKAGVSQSTVSLALRKHSSIPAHTCERVLKVARQMGWEPNPLAAAYMSHLRSTRKTSSTQVNLAYISNYPKTSGLFIGHQEAIIAGAGEQAKEQGYHIDFFNIHETPMTPRQLQRVLKSRNELGVMFSGFTGDSDFSQHFNFSQFAVVAHGYAFPSLALHRVHFNYFHGLQICIQNCLRLGYKKMGLAILPTADASVGGMLYASWHDYVASIPMRSRIPIFKYYCGNKKRFQKWFDAYRPDCVIGTNIGVFKSLVEIGYDIPEDFGFCRFTHSNEKPFVAGVDRRFELLGRFMTEKVIDQVQNNRRGLPHHPTNLAFDGEWKDGSSLPAKK